MRSRSLRIARKDFRDIFRERTVVLALVLQLFIAAFSSFLLVGLVSLYDPAQATGRIDGRVAYVGPGEFSRHLRNESFEFSLLTMEQVEALRAFRDGEVDAVIEEMYDTPDGVRTVNLLLPEGELRTTLLVTLIKDHLKSYERSLREERSDEIATRIVVLEVPFEERGFFAFSYALLVPLLLIVPVFLSGAIAADSITQEIQTKTLDLLRASPAGAAGIFLGKVLAPVCLTPLQGLLWVLLLGLNGIPIHNPVWILLFVTALSLLFVAGAVFFGLSLRKPGDAQVAYSLLVLLAFAATYLLPQPTLATIARLAVGSLTTLEVTMVLGTVATALAALAAAGAASQRLLK